MPPDTAATLSPLMADFEKVAAAAGKFADAGPLGDGYGAFYTQASPEEKLAMIDCLSAIIGKNIDYIGAYNVENSLTRIDTWIDRMMKYAVENDPRTLVLKRTGDFRKQMLRKATGMAVKAAEIAVKDADSSTRQESVSGLADGYRQGATALTAQVEKLDEALAAYLMRSRPMPDLRLDDEETGSAPPVTKTSKADPPPPAKPLVY